MDYFLITRLHSQTFCLEWQEGRVGQLKSKVNKVGESDHRFVHNLLQTPRWTPTCPRE